MRAETSKGSASSASPCSARASLPNVRAITGHGKVNVPIQCAGVAVSPVNIVVADSIGVVVVPLAEAADIIPQARRLLEIEHLFKEKLKAGATVGEPVYVDANFRSAFSYQNRALRHD